MVDQDASFYLMVVVAMSDQEIHEKEATAIKEIADKFKIKFKNGGENLFFVKKFEITSFCIFILLIFFVVNLLVSYIVSFLLQYLSHYMFFQSLIHDIIINHDKAYTDLNNL